MAMPFTAHAAAFNWQQYKGQTIHVLADNNPVGHMIETNRAAFEKKTGIKVEVDMFTEQQMRQRLVTVEDARSDPVDVFMTLPSREGLQFAKAGWYADLTPLTKDVAPDYDFAGLSPALIAAGTIDGHLTNIPVNIEGPALYYRRDVFQKCGVAVPKTLGDLPAVAQKLRACEPAMTPFVSRGLRDALAYTYSVFFHNMGGQYVVNGKSGLCSSAGLAALSLYGNMMKEYGPPGSVNYTFYQISALYRAGRAAMAFESTNELSNMMQGGARLHDTGITLLPPGPGGSHPTVIDWGLAISTYSKHKGAAWLLIQYLSSPAVQAANQLAGIAAPRADIASQPAVKQWLAGAPVRQEWQNTLAEMAKTGTSEVGYPIAQNPLSRQYFGDAVDKVILGAATPQAACAAADTKLNALIAGHAE
ncbi:MAG: sugar ABC transporter substrate-binding protein [Rhodospirillales bacterium]|nr:sugar ABC transporter substrate-binding protein [Rhodospirillales bacterium]